MNQQGHRITKANELVVTSMVSRSQHRNLEDAMQKLQYIVSCSAIVPDCLTVYRQRVHRRGPQGREGMDPDGKAGVCEADPA